MPEESGRLLARRGGCVRFRTAEGGCAAIIIAGTTWAAKGQTPVVKNTGARYRLNMLSVMNRRGGMRFIIEKSKMNG